MSERNLNDFITGYLEYTKDTEPPTSYHTWVAISLIAGALQRRCWIRWGLDTIYPNMYVVLVGPSGRSRKGTAMMIGLDLIKTVGVKLVSDSITREALIRSMVDNSVNATDPDTGKIFFHSSLMVFSEELSVFLGQNDIKFLSNLTNWYDSRDKWEYKTKGAGTDDVQGVCLTMLGATAPDWMQSILPEEAIGGGFTSRVIFVVEERKGKIVPESTMSEQKIELQKKLKEDLGHIFVMSGQMKMEPQAKEAYIDWYTEQERLSEQNIHAIDDPRFAGYCDRRATHVRKLSMCMSASRENSRIVTLGDFERAVSVLKAAELKMSQAFAGVGSSQYAQVTERILAYIRRHRTIKRSVVLRRFYRDIDMQGFGIVEQVLKNMHMIKVKEINPVGNEVTYEYIGP